MGRECLRPSPGALRRVLGVVALGALPGCSLLLDFSSGAVPADASLDAVYTQGECDYLEPNDTFAQAQVVTPGGDTGPAAICAGPPDAGAPDDHDFYRFTVPDTATSVTVALQFTNRPGGDIDLRLYDASQSVIAQSRTFGDGETITCPGSAPACPTLAAGDYTFEVFPAVAGAVNSYTFAVTLQ